MRNPTDITPRWLTEVLTINGFTGSVKGFTSESIGTGQVGENVRYTLTGEGDIPDTVVGKFASPDPISRQTGIDTNNYLREVHFYNQLDNRVNIQTPRVYFSEADAATHEFVILMEDLSPGVQGDQLGGCDESAAILASTMAAHLHGPLWGDTTVLENELIVERANAADALQQMYDALAPGFLARYDARLSATEKQMVVLVGENLASYVSRYTGEKTLVHIDYRLDNMMFGGPYPLAVVDWQSPAFDCALTDLAYFCGTSLEPELRRSIETELVDQYYETLMTYPVTLSRTQCGDLYRQYAPAGLVMAVIASMIVGETPRGNDMFMAMATRSAQMCYDNETIELLRS